MRGAVILAVALAGCGGAAAAPLVGVRAQTGPPAVVLVLDAPLPAGRVSLRFQPPDAPAGLPATVEATAADCAPYAPPGGSTVPCPTESRPLRRCPALTAHLACAAALPAGSMVRLGYGPGGGPGEPGPATCWLGGAPVSCRWEAAS